ncbi:hypothetical protein CPB86DRAFT_549797 [Serendipita vermifera]|nr:hypothetical protein CPB86DRAFT_549797 [Serendipita vermifera]
MLFAGPMKLVTIYTTIIFYFALSRATFVDHEVDDEALMDEDWDDELGLEPAHYTHEKRGGCCDRLKFTVCNMGCGFSCRTPGCATCGQGCAQRCNQVCCPEGVICQ